jgi:hypothetical protein
VNEFTVSELAQKYNVTKRVVLGWCERGKFPNAHKVDSGFGFEVWKIPASDLEGFELPKAGRPPKPKDKD